MFTTLRQSKFTQLAAIGFFALCTAQQSLAAGTESGTPIANAASVDYEVNGVNQTDETSNTISFVVDAKVDFVVTGTDNASVTPGNQETLAFSITNNGNEMFDFALVYESVASDFALDATPVIQIDTTANGSPDTTVTSTGDLAIDASITVWLVGTIPAAATNTQTSTYHLMASALLALGGGALPAQDTDGDSAGVKEYVYAEGDGPHTGDTQARDAKHSAAAIFTVQTAVLSIIKSSAVVWDPINLTNFPLRIPGAVIEYTIIIANGAGATTATAIVVTDTLDGSLILPTAGNAQAPFSATSAISLQMNAGAVVNLTNAADGDVGSIVSSIVTVTGITLNAGDSATVTIQAVIN